MASGPVRVAIIAGAVVVGAVIISKGFPASSGAPSVHSTSPSPTTTPTPPAHKTTKPPPALKGHKKGVLIAVYNATRVTGLASITSKTLQKESGYVVKGLGDFAASNTSVVYFRGGAQGRADGLLLRNSLFKPAKVLPLPGGGLTDSHGTPVPKHAELVVVLGSDYAATHPVS